MLPGLLYLGAAGAAAALGHRSGLPVASAARWLTDVLAGAGVPSAAVGGAVLAALLVALLLAAAGAGLLAQALAALVDRVWSGQWPRWAAVPERVLCTRRQERWARAQQAVTDEPDERGRDVLAAARNRIGLEPPVRPTWIGDRFQAADARVWQQYRLDVTFCWPRLWLAVPDPTRQAVRSATEQYAATTTLGGWAVLYLLPGFLWWPAVLAGPVIGFVAWRRGRATAAVLADLVEATFDMHAPALTSVLGLEPSGAEITPATGRRITERFRKSA